MPFGDVISRACVNGPAACCGPGPSTSVCSSAVPLPGRVFATFGGGTGGLACLNGQAILVPNNGVPTYLGSFLLPGGVCSGSSLGGNFCPPTGQSQFPMLFAMDCAGAPFPSGYPAYWSVSVNCSCLPTTGGVIPNFLTGTSSVSQGPPGPGLPVTITLAPVFTLDSNTGACCPQFCNGVPLSRGDTVQVTVTAADAVSSDPSSPGAVLSRECVTNPADCCTPLSPPVYIPCCLAAVPQRVYITFINCTGSQVGIDLTCLNGQTFALDWKTTPPGAGQWWSGRLPLFCQSSGFGLGMNGVWAGVSCSGPNPVFYTGFDGLDLSRNQFTTIPYPNPTISTNLCLPGSATVQAIFPFPCGFTAVIQS